MGCKEVHTTSCEDTQINFYLPILQGIKANLHLIDREFRVHWANTTGAKCGGRDLSGIKGKHCYEIHLRRTSPCSDCPVRRVFDSHRSHMIERWILLPDGSQKCFEVRVYPIYDQSGKTAYVIKMGFDVTDRKLAGERHVQYVEALEVSLKERTENKHSYRSESADRKNMFNLSKREIQILRLISEGLSNNEISGNLVISPHTVKTHVTHILDKIGVTDRTQAAVLATRLGII